MGRQLRIDFEGAWHHVMHRGAGRRVVFKSDEERLLFLRFVSELDDRFGLEVHAYVLMGNHFHLLLRSAEGRLSEGMQWLLGNFTRWVNNRRGVDGAIFRGRFHGVNVTSEEHRYVLFRYLAENPLDLEGDVDPLSYEWSSLGVVAGRVATSAKWLHRELIEEMYGPEAHLLVDRIVASRSGCVMAGAVPVSGRADEAFATVARAAEVAVGLGGTVERNGLQLGATLALLDDTGRWSRDELGNVAGITGSAVASAVHRTRASMERDPAVSRFVTRIAGLLAVEKIPLGV